MGVKRLNMLQMGTVLRF